MICDEPWFTFHTHHDDGIERTDLQLALCELAKFTRLGHVHQDDDGCMDYADEEDASDELASAESAASSADAGCRASGHLFENPSEFRDVCVRCGCVRLLRGNPSRFVYLEPEGGVIPPT